MGNASVAEVAAKLERATYADELRKAFGDEVFKNPDAAFKAAGLALEVFQQIAENFYPFTSKYDAVLRGEAKLSVAETRGLRLFNDENKGNCASCHISVRTQDGAFPLFTDFGLIALAVPLGRKLKANADPAFYDLGLCGPYRTDMKDHPEYCGLFRTPATQRGGRQTLPQQGIPFAGGSHPLLRAARHPPQRWYARSARASCSSTTTCRRSTTPTSAPMRLRAKLATSRQLTEAEIRDVAAFLRTLTDADQKNAPVAGR